MSKKSDDYDLLLKILILGDTSVGKSNLILRYTKDEFKFDLRSTVGVEFSVKLINIDNINIKAQIWDTAGMERYRSITSAYYRGAMGVLIVYDISNRSSFMNVDRWINDFNAKGENETVLLLIGNKSDLKEKRQVSTEEGQQKANKYNMAFMETSAKENDNVSKAFELLFTEIVKKFKEKNDDFLNENKDNFGNKNRFKYDKIADTMNFRGEKNIQLDNINNDRYINKREKHKKKRCCKEK